MLEIREETFFIDNKEVYVKSINFIGIPILYKECKRENKEVIPPPKKVIGFTTNK